MLEESTIENIFSTLGESLQETAFLFSDPVYDDGPDLSDFEAKGVGLTYEGEPSGQFLLVASEEVLYLLAENLLGVERDDPKALDVGVKSLKETLNIFMGNFLTREYGVTKIFDLGIPEEIEESNWKAASKESQVWMSVEGEFLCLIAAE